MISWLWLIPAILGGATLGVCIMCFFYTPRDPPSPFSDRAITKADRIPGWHG